MDLIKKLWPTPFKIKEKDLVSFLVQLIIFVVVCAVVGWVIGILAHLPIVGIVCWVVGGLLEIYGLVGIILCILKFLGAVK